jgi:hypothetical protein
VSEARKKTEEEEEEERKKERKKETSTKKMNEIKYILPIACDMVVIPLKEFRILNNLIDKKNCKQKKMNRRILPLAAEQHYYYYSI